MDLAINQLSNNPVKLKALLQNSLQREDKLKQQIHSLLEALRLEKHRLYGTSSEKSPDQSELFDEADTFVDEAEEPGVAASSATQKQNKKSPTRKPLPP